MRELDKALAAINKDAGAEIIKQGTEIIYVDKIPFSSPTMNYMTYGGVPIGKVTEFFGGENGGKTTTALDIVANAQQLFEEEFEFKCDELEKAIDKLGDSKSNAKAKANKIKELEDLRDKGPKAVVYIDLENTLDVEWARLLGVDTELMYLLRPENQTAEQVLQYTIDLMKTGEVGLVVLDSIPCLIPQQVFEEDLEKKSYGGVSKVLTDFSNRIPPIVAKHHITFIGINQVREDLNSTYAHEVTPGGRAWKHLCSLRLKFKKGDNLDANNTEIPRNSENPAGNKVQAEIVKTKVCRPNRRLGYYTLNYIDGIDVLYDTIQMGIRYNFILKSGAWFNLCDPDTGEILTDEDGAEIKLQGRSKLIQYLNDNPDVYEDLYCRIDEKLHDDSIR